MADAREEKFKKATLKLDKFRRQQIFNPAELMSVQNVCSEGPATIGLSTQYDTAIVASKTMSAQGVQVGEMLNHWASNESQAERKYEENLTTSNKMFTIKEGSAITEAGENALTVNVKEECNTNLGSKLDAVIYGSLDDVFDEGESCKCDKQTNIISEKMKVCQEILSEPHAEDINKFLGYVSKKIKESKSKDDINSVANDDSVESTNITELKPSFKEKLTDHYVEKIINDNLDDVSKKESVSVESDEGINSISGTAKCRELHEETYANYTTEGLNDFIDVVTKKETVSDESSGEINTIACQEKLFEYSKEITNDSLDDVMNEENISGENYRGISNIFETSKKESVSSENNGEISTISDPVKSCKEKIAVHSMEDMKASLDDVSIDSISEPMSSCEKKCTNHSKEVMNDTLDDMYYKENISSKNDIGADAISVPSSSFEEKLVDHSTDIMNDFLDDVLKKENFCSKNQQGTKVISKSSPLLGTISKWGNNYETHTVPEARSALDNVSKEENISGKNYDVLCIMSEPAKLVKINYYLNDVDSEEMYVSPDLSAKEPEPGESKQIEAVIKNQQVVKNIIDKNKNLDNVICREESTVNKINIKREEMEKVLKDNVSIKDNILEENTLCKVSEKRELVSQKPNSEIDRLIESPTISSLNKNSEQLEIKHLEKKNEELFILLAQEQVSNEQLKIELENKTCQLDNLKGAMLVKMKEVYQAHFKEKSDMEKLISDTNNKFSEQLDNLSKTNISLNSEKIELTKNNVELKNTLTSQFKVEVAKQTEKLRQKGKKCEDLQSKLEDLQRNNVQVQNKLSALNLQYILLLKESGTQQLLNEKELIISNLRKELLLAKKTFNDMSEEKNNLIHEKNQMAIQYSTYSKDLASHTEKLSELLQRFQGENARLVQRERALLEHVAALETQTVSSNTGGSNGEREELCILKEKYLFLESQIKVTTGENVALKKRISERIEEAKGVKLSNDREFQILSHKLENKERRILELEAHIEQVENSNCLNIEKLEKSLDAKAQQILILESQLKNQVGVGEKQELQSKLAQKQQKILELLALLQFRSEEEEGVIKTYTKENNEHELIQKDISSLNSHTNEQLMMIQREPFGEDGKMTEDKCKILNNDKIEPDENHLNVDEKKEERDKNKDPDKDAGICEEMENRLKLAMERIYQLTIEKAHLEELVSDLQDETEMIGDYITIYQNQRKEQKKRLKEKEENLQKEKQQLTENLQKEKQQLTENLQKEKQQLTDNLLQMQRLVKKFVKEEEADIYVPRDESLKENAIILKQIPDADAKVLKFSKIGPSSSQRVEHEFEPWLWQPAAGKVVTV